MGKRVTQCKACGHFIVFLQGRHGVVPCDSITVGPNDVHFDRGVHRAHFATCPNADEFRKARRRR